MKKLFAKITSLAVASVMSIFMLSGCQLITTNAERDMAQVIATVAVDDALKEDVYKRELVSAYNSSGYYYIQYQGMGEKETYEILLESLVKNKILVQQARLALTGASSINTVGYFQQASSVNFAERTSIENILTTNNYKGDAPTTVKKTDGLDKFLTEYEYYEVKHSVLSSVQQYINGYKDEEEDEHDHDPYETFQGVVRTTLTVPSEETYNEWELRYDPVASVVDVESEFYKAYQKTNKDAELGLDLSTYQTKYDLSLAVYKKYCETFTVDASERTAVNRLIKDLKKLGFITSAEAAKKAPSTGDEFLTLTYFKDLLESNFESQILAKYELALQNENEKKLADDDALFNAYKNIYDTQKIKYQNNYTAYEDALSKASDTSLVVYNPTATEGKYGYVINLLIGFSDEQTAIYDSLTGNGSLTATERAKARENLLKTLTAKDLRDSWVEKNYGKYDETTKTFSFDKKYVKTEGYDILTKYQGNILGAQSYVYHDDYNDEQTAYSYKSVKGNEIPFDSFYSSVSTIMGFSGYSGRIAGYTNEEVISDSDMAKFKDLVFAYSTDGGSLQDNYGYVYSPKTSKDTYVPEFADAAKNVVDAGVGAYEVVATRYGYHIILCTKVINPTATNIDITTFKAQANDSSNKDTIPYLFKEYQKDALVLDNVSKITETFFKNSLESAVKYYTEVYEDLIPSEE
ncbi:MAG: peptidylprolyl isomerase [Clostridia bacterium]|nr:peptidylprolyl isomerase [Clostridia bacterium]